MSEFDITAFIPTVIESHGKGERHMDLFSQMFQNGTIQFFGDVTSESARLLCSQLTYLSKEDPSRIINLVINSNGGSLYDAIAVVDTMRTIPNKVSTCVLGMAFSAGSLIAAAGTKGYRVSTPNSTFMIHQPAGGAKGTARSIEQAANEILRMKKLTNSLLSSFSKLSEEEIAKLVEGDHYMSAEESLKCGFIDRIIPWHNPTPLADDLITKG